MDLDETPVHNAMPGVVHGSLVQAGSIGQVTFTSPVPNHRIPAQLPPVPRSFTNRHNEIARLHRWSSADDGPGIAVLTGTGGIRKTSLASRWLHDSRDRFVDGQLYADLGAHASSGPVPPEQVLEWFLIALGAHPRTIPVDLGQRQALFRSWTAGRAIAVLLDNAASANQVRPLLPASACAVVVTSQRRLAGLALHGARFLEVNPLTLDDSARLLSTIVGHRLSGDHADELARLCGGIPIAVAVVGAQLVAHPQRCVDRQVSVLRDEYRLAHMTLDGSSVEVIFDVAYDALSDDEKQVYRLCALHPGPEFGVQAAAAAMDKPVNHVNTVLQALVDRSVLTEVGDQRYRYHDLLQLDARQRAELTDSEPDRDAAIRRVVEWYLDQAVETERVLRGTRRHIGPRLQGHREPAFASHHTALGWLTQEQRNLTAVVTAAAEHGWDDLTWQFCEALWGFFLHVRNYTDFRDIHELGIPAAHRTGDVLAEAQLRAQLCFALCGLGRYDEARIEGETSLALADAAENEQAQAVALGELAGAARGSGDLPGALKYLRQVKEIRERIGTARAVALTQRGIGEVYAELKKYDDAIATLRAAADAVKDLDRAQYARALTCLGKVYLTCERPDDAEPVLTTALDITRDLKASHYEAHVLVELGTLAEHRGDLERARHLWAAAREIYATSGDPLAATVTERLAQLPPPDHHGSVNS